MLLFVKCVLCYILHMAKNILIIEDDLDIYNLYKTQLELSGYSVMNVSAGDKAIDAVREHKPDLVLLDLVLPGKNGLEILQEIKEDSELRSQRVVMLTNFGNEDNISKAIELGAEDYIMKYNIVPEELAAKVSTLLGDASDSVVKLMS